MKRSSGFTLIELMIVVAIIGIIAATVLPLFGIGTELSRQKAGGRQSQTFTQYQSSEPVVTCVSGMKFVDGKQIINPQGHGISC